VDICWRRLYTDASIVKACLIICENMGFSRESGGKKRKREGQSQSRTDYVLRVVEEMRECESEGIPIRKVDEDINADADADK
ncbi:hypothetical protein ASPCADRAFT_207981, partial [Aspergillus carbonarius ITEM 5010]